MNNKLVYIAGPYRAATPINVAENVCRATRLARYAVEKGLLPIVPHLHGHAGVFGDPSGNDPAIEERVMRWCSELARHIGEQGGAYWAIRQDSGGLSNGTYVEYAAYVEGYGDSFAARAQMATWSEWRKLMGEVDNG